MLFIFIIRIIKKLKHNFLQIFTSCSTLFCWSVEGTLWLCTSWPCSSSSFFFLASSKQVCIWIFRKSASKRALSSSSCLSKASCSCFCCSICSFYWEEKTRVNLKNWQTKKSKDLWHTPPCTKFCSILEHKFYCLWQAFPNCKRPLKIVPKFTRIILFYWLDISNSPWTHLLLYYYLFSN